MRYLLALLMIPLGGCPADRSETSPPANDPYFPTGLAVSPDWPSTPEIEEKFLFVVSANSNLQYDSGTVQVYDLDQVDQIVNLWLDEGRESEGCTVDASRPEALLCDTSKDNGDPASFVVAGASVAIGNFAVAVAAQPLASEGRVRLFVTVRGDPSVTYIDFDEASPDLECGGSGDLPRCDDAHRLSAQREDEETLGSLPGEPFYVSFDEQDHVFVTHLTSGLVSLVRAPTASATPTDFPPPPMLMHSVNNLWAPSIADGSLGAAGIAPRNPAEPGGLIYVTSPREARVATVRVGAGPDLQDPNDPGTIIPGEELVRGPSFFINGVAGDAAASNARGLAFLDGGNRMVIVNRTPPSLIILDTSIGETGVPENRVLGQVEVCTAPAIVATADFGDGPIAYVPCFATGQVYAIDVDRAETLAVVESGRGPNSVVAASARGRVYVANYAEDTISVIDARSGSETAHHVVVRLGKLREGN